MFRGLTIDGQRSILKLMSIYRTRKRLLFLVDALDHDYQAGVTHGVVRGARRLGADVMILVGGQMVYLNKYLENRKFIYELAGPSDFDGMVLLGTSLSSQQGLAAIAPLIIRFASLPTVSIGLDIGKGVNILVDNAEGMTQITEHLLTVHQFRRFAYISGPENNNEAKIRLKAFRSALAKQGLALSTELLVTGAFTEASGERAMCQLLDERKADIKSIDAIVAANDSMAVGAMDELKRRGFRVPADIAIVGFDDIEAARYADTPLTTVQQPLMMQGERAVEQVLGSYGAALLDHIITVNPKLVIRRSCGCGSKIESPILSTSPPGNFAETLEMVVRRKRNNIENDLASVAERGGIARGWERAFVDAVIDAFAGKGYRMVTEAFATLVRKSIETGEGVHVWTLILAALDKHLSLLVNAGTEDSARVEALLHRSRTAMAEAVEHFHSTKVRELRNQNFAFNQAAIAMLTTLDPASLVDAATEHLPRLGIDSCSISLFKKMGAVSASMKPLLVLDGKKRVEILEPFPAHAIAAPLLTANRPHALVVEPLCFYDEIFGAAAFEYGPSEGSVYEQLGAFFSAAIKALSLTESGVRSVAAEETAAHIDPLTGIYNRNHLQYRFFEESARAVETGRPLSLIVLDMDDFKKLNDALGAEQGDAALKGVAETIKRCVKPTEITLRLEEDHFAVLLPDTTAEKATATAELIKRRLKLSLGFQYHGHIAASFGVATTIAPHETDEKTLTEEAVRALVFAKRRGKDRVVHVSDLET